MMTFAALSYSWLLLAFISSLPSQSSSFIIPSSSAKTPYRSSIAKKIESYENFHHEPIRFPKKDTTTQLQVLQKSNSMFSPMVYQNLSVEALIDRMVTFCSTMRSTIHGFSQGMNIALKQSWWCFPMVLMIYPIIALVNGSYAQMPSWWSMCDLSHLHTSRVGHCICFGFLISNIFYLLSGLYLLNVIPSSESKSQSIVLEHRSLLGWLVLCSGGISLLYHSFQAWGAINIAESLCFIDHGLALSSGCCFFDKCGLPSTKTLLIGAISLSMLSISGDVYPIIHSFWHLGSAAVTISWAFDGSVKRKRFIIDTLRERRISRQLI